MGHDHRKVRRLLLITASLMALLVTSACHRPLRSGMNALAEGNWEKAEKNAETGLEKDRTDPEFNLMMADALVGQERWADAERYAKRAYDSGTLPGRAGRTYGKVLWELDRPVDAVRAWESARESDPSMVPDGDYTRALAHAIDASRKANQHETVLALRRELAEVSPDHAEASDEAILGTREALAEELVREGNYERAVEVYEELSADYPDNDGYAFERGRLLATLGEDDRAIEAFDEFVKAGDETERRERIRDVAKRTENIGAFRVAMHFYDREIEVLPDEPSRKRARVHRKLAGLLLSAGARDQGEQHLREFVEDMTAVGPKPVSAEIYYSAANVATQNRQPDLAIDLLEEAITRAAPNWRVSRRLAELYARRARTNDVERVLRTYVERADSKTTAKVVVGRWASGRRNFELARFFLEGAVEDGDVTAEVWLELARVYSALGYMDEVRRALKTYTDEASNRRDALFDVATIYRAQRMYEEAEDALREALKGRPDDLLVVKLLEELYREWGRPKKIHELYDAWAKARGNKPEDLQLIGERFLRQQDRDDALPYLVRAAKAGQTDAWLQVAEIYNRQRRERDMKEALDKYLASSTDRARALNAVLQQYRVSNWNYEAIPILEELIKLEPRNVLHYEQLSQLYFEQGRDVEAFELWKRYISLSPNPIASLETMSRRFQRRQHQDWMLQFLHQVLERESQPDPRIYRLLGDTYADVWANQQRGRPPTNLIFTRENKAKEYYKLYLEKAEPSRGELQSFAESMRQKQYWTIAAQAFSKLRKKAPLQSHQLLNYGTVLLNLGQADEAEAVFADYYDRRKKSVEAAMAISDQLFSAKRYDSVEPYLKAMLDNGDEALVRQAFMRLAEVYRNSDRTEELPALIADFLDRTQNPAKARRDVHVMLESAGMWDEAAAQLQKVTEIQGADTGYALGVNLFRAGKRDEADDAFRDYAANNVNPANAWLQVGEFYATRGEVEKARNAFQNAANAAPQSELPHASLGQFQIMTGRIDEGRAAFEKARSNLPHNQRGNLFRVEVEALMNAGRFGEAREVARDAVAVAYLDRDYFYSVLASTELDSGDSVRSQRMVDELKGANLPLGTVVRLLRGAGYLEESADLIDKEIVGGDYVLGGDVLLRNADLFTRIGGVTRLMRSAQPLLERTQRDPRIPRELGRFLVQEGHLEEGAMLLRQAVEAGDSTLRTTLAGVYASLGHHDEAFEMLQAALASLDSFSRSNAIAQLGFRYEILGERERFRGLLEHLVRDSRFAHDAIGYLIRYMVDDGEVSMVVDTVSRMMADRAPSETNLAVTDDQGLEFSVAALTSASEELAIAGFVQEASQLIAQAPPTVRDHEAMRDLRLRIAAFADGVDTEAEFRSALRDLGSSTNESWQRLSIAELASRGGHTKLATEVAEPLLDSPDFGVSSRAFRVLMRNAMVANEPEQIDRWVNAYKKANADKMSVRQTVYSELVHLGLDKRALDIAIDQASRIPIQAHVDDALEAAQMSGNPREVSRWSRRLIEVDRQNPITTLRSDLSRWSLRQEDSLNQPLRDVLGDQYFELLLGVQTEIANSYRIGEPFEARDRLREYLEEVEMDPAAVEAMALLLDQYRLVGDLSRVLGPMVPDEARSVTTRRLIGLANLTVGFEDDGFAILDRTIEVAPDAAHESARIADELLRRRLYAPALRYAESAVARRPNRPEGRLVRGLARIGVGDLEGADEDLDQALQSGLSRNAALQRAGVIALRNGHRAFAYDKLEELLTAHHNDLTRPGDAVRVVLAAFNQAGRGEEGVKFLEQRRPAIAAMNGISGQMFVSSLSQLYENAGKADRAYEVYEAGLRRQQFTSPFADDLSTYRNNLAYTFSTTNDRIDDGMELIRSAIAHAPRRDASHIDTLGWLYFRQNDLERAEREIRRAIRSSTGSPLELEELYNHLGDIRALRGYHSDAVWHWIFADSITYPSD